MTLAAGRGLVKPEWCRSAWRASSARAARNGLLPFRANRASRPESGADPGQPQGAVRFPRFGRAARVQAVRVLRAGRGGGARHRAGLDDEARGEVLGDARPAELPLLFQRILQNAHPRPLPPQKVRSTWTTLLSNLGLGARTTMRTRSRPWRSTSSPNVPASPAERLEQSQVMAAIEDAVKALPDRQREAFMLRYWEELDVSETAKVMGCSEGSVKTHCSRATHALAKVLRSKGITL